LFRAWQSSAQRRVGPTRDLIEAVVANMRRNLERLKYSTLAPSRDTVYLLPEAPMIVPVMDYVDVRFEEQMYLRPAHM
jgi:hypothetical protein